MTHNLNIQSYSFDEILGIFNLTHNISENDLKRAKKQVLMTHPDKSKLSSEYFLFYKKAFEQIVYYYENMNKTTQKIPENTIYYNNTNNENYKKQIHQNIQKMNHNDFHTKFNTLFEQNMAKKIDASRNEWFSSNEPVIQYDNPTNISSMNRAFEDIKRKNAALIIYSGVNELYTDSIPASQLYDEYTDNNEYVTCDPFSKLKFDDLRKVHKDQTVLSVSERDFDKMAKYGSVDQFVRARDSTSLTPMEKTRAERILMEQSQNKIKQMSNLAYQSELRTMQYAEKNKQVLSTFLRLS